MYNLVLFRARIPRIFGETFWEKQAFIMSTTYPTIEKIIWRWLNNLHANSCSPDRMYILYCRRILYCTFHTHSHTIKCCIISIMGDILDNHYKIKSFRVISAIRKTILQRLLLCLHLYSFIDPRYSIVHLEGLCW